MGYPARSLVHDRRFDRDCEHFFGSLDRADDRLANFLFELAHGVAVGSEIVACVTAFVVHHEPPCVVIVEVRNDHLLLRALVPLDVALRIAA